jgi:hypothetical protein
MGGELISLLGLAKVNLKIFNLSHPVWVFVINSCEQDLVIGLDLIKKFRLSQDHNLKISQYSFPIESSCSSDSFGLPFKAPTNPAAAGSIATIPEKQQQLDSFSSNPVMNFVSPTEGNSNNDLFVSCDVCHGHFKDQEQLRDHMQWIHKLDWGEHMSFKKLSLTLKHLNENNKKSYLFLLTNIRISLPKISMMWAIFLVNRLG